MELVENLIKRNDADMKRINLLLKSLDKLNSNEVSGRIKTMLIDETLKLVNINKQLKEYLTLDNQKSSGSKR